MSKVGYIQSDDNDEIDPPLKANLMTKQDDDIGVILDRHLNEFHLKAGHRDKLEKAIEALIKEQVRLARLNQLDQLIDIESKTFNKWTQKDIANFFDTVGKQYRQLEQEVI